MMNKLFSFVLGFAFACMGSLSAQTNNQYEVTLKKQTTDTPVAKAYLYSLEAHRMIDSAQNVSGTYRFQGTTTYLPQVACITENKKLRVDDIRYAFVLDNTPTTISEGDNNRITLSGSAENAAFDQWKQTESQLLQERKTMLQSISQVVNQYKGKLPDSLRISIGNQINQLNQKEQEAAIGFINAHPGTLVTAFLLDRYQNNLSTDFVSATLKGLDKHAENALVYTIKKNHETNLRRSPGSLFTDFSLPDAKGTLHKLSEWVGTGNYVLLDFWASWCGPCRAEMPYVKAAYEKYHDKGFEIVGVSLDNNRESWLKTCQQLGITWPQLSDLKGWECAASRIYGIQSIPQTILFDPDGKVIATNLRGKALEEKLAEVLE